MEVVEVLPIEASKSDHTTANESSTVSPSWPWVIILMSSDFKGSESICIDINDKKVVQIVAKASSKDIYLSIMDS
jgi:hypothetical protein